MAEVPPPFPFMDAADQSVARRDYVTRLIKYLLASAFLVIMTAFAVDYALFLEQYQDALERRDARMNTASLNLARDLSESVTHVKMLARSSIAQDLQPDSQEAYLALLRPELERLVLLSGIYEGASYVDHNGSELIRIDQRNPTQASAQPPRHLGNQRCIEQAAMLGRTEAFITSVVVHPEAAPSLTAPLSSICVAAPVFSGSGEKAGVIALYYPSDKLFEGVERVFGETGGFPILISDDGFLLYGSAFNWHPRSAASIPFSLNQVPLLWDRIKNKTTGIIKINGDSFMFRTLNPQVLLQSGYTSLKDQEGAVIWDQNWKLVSHVPSQRTEYAQSGRPLITALLLIPLLLATAFAARAAARSASSFHQRRRQLLQYETAMAGFMNSDTAMVFLASAQRVITGVTQPMAEAFGLSREQLIGKRLEDLPGLARSPAPSPFSESFSNPFAASLPVPLPGATDSKPGTDAFAVLVNQASSRMFHIQQIPVPDMKGEPVALCCIATDITPYQSAQENMRLAMTAFEQMDEAIVVTDRKLKILTANPAFMKLCQYGLEELQGRDVRFLNQQLSDRSFSRMVRRTLLREGAWKGELQTRRKSGELCPAWLTITAVKQDEEITHYILLLSDLSVAKEAQQRIHYLSHHDALTELPNRMLFEDRLEHALTEAKYHQWNSAVLLLDLDQFRLINDSLGHRTGDLVLRAVAQRLKSSLREDDTLAHLGSDEFGVLLHQIQTVDEVERIAQKLAKVLELPIDTKTGKVSIGVSIGIGLFPGDADSAENLMIAADIALQRAKKEGRRTHAYFSQALADRVKQRHHHEQQLRASLERRQLALFYQPQICLVTGKVMGLEALLRWNHPTMGLHSSAELIEAAEENGLIHELGEWILQEAFHQAAEWSRLHVPIGRLSVNVSGQQLMSGDLVELVTRCLTNAQWTPGIIELELEITETVLQHPERSYPVIRQLRSKGIKVAIDDFGTGYSSLSQLTELSIDRLKIPGVFMDNIPQQENARSIAQAIVSLAHSLGLPVVAEGVESKEQVAFLRSIRCDIAQGYFYSQPLPAQAVAQHPLFRRDRIITS